MALLTRKTLLLAKTESVYGVDANPDPNQDAIEISDVNITPNIDKVERNLFRDTLSPLADIPAKKYTELTFSVELKGNGLQHDGTTVPRIVRLFEACGFQTTAHPESSAGAGDGYFELKPISSNFPSLTFYVYLDQVLYKVVGARGNVEIVLEANNIGKANFTFQGLFVQPVDASMPSATYEAPDLVPPLAKGVNLTMGSSFTPCLQAFSVNMNNQITQRDCLTAEEGVGDILITSRKPEGSLDPDMFLSSQYDVWSKFVNGTPEQISGTLGKTAGNRITVTIPKAVYSSIGIGDRDTVRIYDIGFTCIGQDDEVIIKLH